MSKPWNKFDIYLVFDFVLIPWLSLGGVLLVLLGGGSFLDVFPLGGLHSQGNMGRPITISKNH